MISFWGFGTASRRLPRWPRALNRCYFEQGSTLQRRDSRTRPIPIRPSMGMSLRSPRWAAPTVAGETEWRPPTLKLSRSYGLNLATVPFQTASRIYVLEPIRLVSRPTLMHLPSLAYGKSSPGRLCTSPQSPKGSYRSSDASHHPSPRKDHSDLVIKNVLVAMVAVLLVGCADPTPRAKLKTALDTTSTHQEKLEATSRFIESIVLSKYNAIEGPKWERHVPEAIRQAHADLDRAGFEPAQEGQAYRIPSMIYAHEYHQITMWIEATLNKLRIVVAACDASTSRQLLASHLVLTRRDRIEQGAAPIHVAHRSQTEGTVPDDWVPCSPTENQ